MGKILCETTTTTTVSPAPSTWREAPPSSAVSTNVMSWEDVTGLEAEQKRWLSRLGTKGVLWKNPDPHPEDIEMDLPDKQVLLLWHGGEVESDGNCLFTAGERVFGEAGLRRKAVRRFQEDYGAAGEKEKEEVDRIIRNMYSPDLKLGWGVHVVQELKLLLHNSQRPSLEDRILQLLHLGMQRESAAESIYKETCIAVDDGPSWAKYMSISGSPHDEYHIITLQYTQDGLLTVDENTQGRAAAFGDDIAIQCLATEFHREIFVVQAHGSDAMVDEDNCVFFLPHRPRGQINGLPVFLFMKGTGWCGAGGDHYEPLIAHPSSLVSQEKVGFVL